jgi:hypothetical protein
MGSYVKALLLLIVLVVLVTFGIKNNETMILHFYFQLSSIPLPEEKAVVETEASLEETQAIENDPEDEEPV